DWVSKVATSLAHPHTRNVAVRADHIIVTVAIQISSEHSQRASIVLVARRLTGRARMLDESPLPVPQQEVAVDHVDVSIAVDIRHAAEAFCLRETGECRICNEPFRAVEPQPSNRRQVPMP